MACYTDHSLFPAAMKHDDEKRTYMFTSALLVRGFKGTSARDIESRGGQYNPPGKRAQLGNSGKPSRTSFRFNLPRAHDTSGPTAQSIAAARSSICPRQE